MPPNAKMDKYCDSVCHYSLRGLWACWRNGAQVRVGKQKDESRASYAEKETLKRTRDESLLEDHAPRRRFPMACSGYVEH